MNQDPSPADICSDAINTIHTKMNHPPSFDTLSYPVGTRGLTTQSSEMTDQGNLENGIDEWGLPQFSDNKFLVECGASPNNENSNVSPRDDLKLDGTFAHSTLQKLAAAKSFCEDMMQDITNSPKIPSFTKDFQPIPMVPEYSYTYAPSLQPQIPPQMAIPQQQPPVHDELENDSEDEGIEDYKAGGYHPVHIGEVILDRYVIIQKLGWGHFSTVWLAKDHKYDTYVALKVQKSSPHYLEAAYDEVEILQRVARMADKPEWKETLKEYYKDEGRTEFTRDDCQVVQLLNSFIYKGPYGNHFCMVFEILGVNLLEIIKRYNYKGIPMHLCRVIAKQVLIGLDFLHRICGVIHTDLKPENVLLCLTPEEISEIYEKGMLQRSKEYGERIRAYQRKYGLQVTEEPIVEPVQQTPKNKGPEGVEATTTVFNGVAGKNLTRNQKKKLKKKNRKIRAKLESQHATETKDHDNDDEHEEDEEKNPPPVVEEPAPQNEQPVSNSAEKTKWRGKRIDKSVRIKIADLGNACWLHHHFSPEIQTRQYRSPEVILGVHYGPTADVWSLACMLFEMLTGDFLFDPRKGPNFGKDDDHLAQIVELTRKYPKKFARSGTTSRKFFDRNGDLRRIRSFHFWSLKEVLVEKYKIHEEEAEMFAKFMGPMLEFYPDKRASAQKCMSSGWLKMPDEINFKMNPEEFEAYLERKKQRAAETEVLEINHEPEESENEFGDDEGEDDYDDNEGRRGGNFVINSYNKTILDRSFYHGGYVGFGDGIYLDQLDQGTNWQFQKLDKKKGKK